MASYDQLTPAIFSVSDCSELCLITASCTSDFPELYLSYRGIRIVIGGLLIKSSNESQTWPRKPAATVINVCKYQ